MRQTGRETDHGHSGKRAGFVQQHVIDGQDDLLGIEAELNRDLFDRIDGRAVDVGLAGLAQAWVAGTDSEPLDQTLETRRPAIHRRRLHHLRDDEGVSSRAGLHRVELEPPPDEPAPVSRRPAARSTSVTGLTRSTWISRLPGNPC